MPKILVVDDDITLCSMLIRRIESAGYSAVSAHTLLDGFNLAHESNFDAILLDVVLPDGNGVEYITHFFNVQSNPEIIIMTGAGDPHGAECAIKLGAWGYLEKQHIIRDLLLPITRALEYRKEKQKVVTIKVALRRERIIGDSPAINTCLDQLAAAATSDACVLITGETGTGKEIFARTLHDNSSRAKMPFIVIDCAALPESLVESVLFGHIKGSFTGASVAQQGLIQLANGGTLFLDEVGELPLDIQKKFLRVLQEGKYRPVGSAREITSNFRVIAATNRNLDVMINQGQFRSDLLFRLRSFHLHLPPLRDRLEDIPTLVRHITSRICTQMTLEHKIFSADFIEYLQSHGWPGNVRELDQLLEEVCTQARQHHTLFSYHLPDRIRIHQAQGMLENPFPAFQPVLEKKQLQVHQPSLMKDPVPWKKYKQMMEKEYLAHVMAYADGNIQEASKISGISRARVYQLISKTKYNKP